MKSISPPSIIPDFDEIFFRSPTTKRQYRTHILKFLTTTFKKSKITSSMVRTLRKKDIVGFFQNL